MPFLLFSSVLSWSLRKLFLLAYVGGITRTRKRKNKNGVCPVIPTGESRQQHRLLRWHSLLLLSCP